MTVNPAESELLIKLIQECNEVSKAATKILLHGYDSFDPTDQYHPGNKIELQEEIKDLLCMIAFLIAEKDIEIPKTIRKTYKYLNEQRDNLVECEPFKYILTGVSSD